MMNNSPYVPMITAAAQKYGVDTNLALRLVQQESGFNQGSISNRGAIGLTQLMPGTAQDLGVNPNDPAQNVDGGMRYLRQMQDRYNGSVPLALAAYNAGPARVDSFLHNGTPLPSETTNYIQSIQGTPMANPNTPALIPQMQMAQQTPTPVQSAMQGDSPNYDNFLNSVQRAGAWLTSIANPAGGAALLNATNLPLFRQRYQVVTDQFGRQHVFDLHRGTFVSGGPAAPGTPGAQPQANTAAAPAATDMSEGGPISPNFSNPNNPINTPLGLKQQMVDSGKKFDTLTDAYQAASELNDLAQKAKRLSMDPNVYQGGGAGVVAEAKNYAPGFLGLKGNDETQELEKLNSQLNGQWLKSLGNMRIAAPEIKFGELANADIDKPSKASQQIYDDIIAKTQRVKDIYEKFALPTRNTYGVLGPEYDAAVSQFMNKHPLYQDTTVQPQAPGNTKRPPLSDIFK